MFLYNYFSEIKNRLILIIICWITVFIICYFYKETLLFLLVKLGIKENKLSDFYFISTDLTDVLSVYINLSYFISIQVAIMAIFYHGLTFLSPGLFLKEYQYIKILILNSFSFILVSIFIFNAFVLPHIWSFFLSFNKDSLYAVTIFFESKITEYIRLYKNFYYIVILISQLFVLFFFSIEYVKNKIKFVLKTRKLLYFIFLLIATIITPPDIFSQLVVILVLVFIFEFLVLVIIIKNFMDKYLLNNYNYIF